MYSNLEIDGLCIIQQMHPSIQEMMAKSSMMCICLLPYKKRKPEVMHPFSCVLQIHDREREMVVK